MQECDDIPTKMTHWLSNFLVGRAIQVNVNGFMSNQINPKAGIPQNSFPSPFLFRVISRGGGGGGGECPVLPPSLILQMCVILRTQGWIGYEGTHVPMFVPRLGKGLSPTMGFLDENENLAYFAILGDLSSDLSFLWAFQDFKFSPIISWLFQGQGRTYLATS